MRQQMGALLVIRLRGGWYELGGLKSGDIDLSIYHQVIEHGMGHASAYLPYKVS